MPRSLCTALAFLVWLGSRAGAQSAASISRTVPDSNGTVGTNYQETSTSSPASSGMD